MKTFFRNLLILQLLILSSSSVLAQRALVDESSPVNGRIDEINQDEHYIVIDGKRIEYRDAEVEVIYNGEQVDSVVLDSGQRVGYRTRQDGSVSEIRLLSRLRLEQQPNNH